MRIATPSFFCFPFAWNIFFHPLTFSLYVSLGLMWVSCRQHIYGSYFCIHSTTLRLLVGAFNPFTFKVIIDIKHLPAMQETWVRSLGRENALEKEMATHSSILAWRIPWTEEPGGLQSMGSQRVGHDWVTSLSLSWSYCHFLIVWGWFCRFFPSVVFLDYINPFNICCKAGLVVLNLLIFVCLKSFLFLH